MLRDTANYYKLKTMMLDRADSHQTTRVIFQTYLYLSSQRRFV